MKNCGRVWIVCVSLINIACLSASPVEINVVESWFSKTPYETVLQSGGLEYKVSISADMGKISRDGNIIQRPIVASIKSSGLTGKKNSCEMDIQCLAELFKSNTEVFARQSGTSSKSIWPWNVILHTQSTSVSGTRLAHIYTWVIFWVGEAENRDLLTKDHRLIEGSRHFKKTLDNGNVVIYRKIAEQLAVAL